MSVATFIFLSEFYIEKSFASGQKNGMIVAMMYSRLGGGLRGRNGQDYFDR